MIQKNITVAVSKLIRKYIEPFFNGINIIYRYGYGEV